MKRSLSRLSDYAYERFGGGFMIAMGVRTPTTSVKATVVHMCADSVCCCVFVQALGSVFNLIVGFMLAMHLIASVFYIIGDADDGWVPVAFPIGTESIMERYFQSMMHVSLGEFPDETQANEELFAVFSVLFNSFVFGAVAATFSSIMVSAQAVCVAYAIGNHSDRVLVPTGATERTLRRFQQQNR